MIASCNIPLITLLDILYNNGIADLLISIWSNGVHSFGSITKINNYFDTGINIKISNKIIK